MAQIFAVMPVQGLSGTNASTLYFSWCSFPIIYCITVISLTVIYTLLTLLKTAKNEVTADSLGR